MTCPAHIALQARVDQQVARWRQFSSSDSCVGAHDEGDAARVGTSPGSRGNQRGDVRGYDPDATNNRAA